MGYSTVLRFSHSGGNTDFDELEIPSIRVEHVQRTDMFVLRTNNVKMYNIGVGFKRVIVTFDLVRKTTVDKLKTLFDLVDSYEQSEVMTCYYLYQHDTGVSCYVQMKRDEFKQFWGNTGKLRKQVPITFQEAINTATTVARVFSFQPMVATEPGTVALQRLQIFVNMPTN